MRNNVRNYVIALVGLTTLGLSSLAFTEHQSDKNFHSTGDTLPKPKAAKKDFDKEIQDIDKAMKELQNTPDIDFGKLQKDLDESMKKLNEQMSKHKVDMEKMQKDLKESMEKFDSEKLESELKASLNQLDKIDVQKLQDELKASLSNLDSEKMRAQIDASLKNLDKLDLEKMKKEIEQSMERIKTNIHPEEIEKKVRESMDKVDFNKIQSDMNRAKEEMEKNKGNMKVNLDNARKSLAKAKQEFQGYQEMVYKMEDDGLLSTKADYKIEYKDGKLSINGIAQPDNVTNKYKKYFRKNGVTIKKEKGELNINTNEN